MSMTLIASKISAHPLTFYAWPPWFSDVAHIWTKHSYTVCLRMIDISGFREHCCVVPGGGGENKKKTVILHFRSSRRRIIICATKDNVKLYPGWTLKSSENYYNPTQISKKLYSLPFGYAPLYKQPVAAFSLALPSRHTRLAYHVVPPVLLTWFPHRFDSLWFFSFPLLVLAADLYLSYGF